MIKEGRPATSKECGSGAPATALIEVNINTVVTIVRDVRQITFDCLSKSAQMKEPGL